MTESSDTPSTDPVTRYGQLTTQLRELEGKTDPASRRLFEELIDELICVDMTLQPYRQRKPPKPGGPS